MKSISAILVAIVVASCSEYSKQKLESKFESNSVKILPDSPRTNIPTKRDPLIHTMPISGDTIQEKSHQ